MARSRRHSRESVDIWPGFVDALSTLLLAIIFMLVVFVLGQFFLSQMLQRRGEAMTQLEATIDQLLDQIQDERDVAGVLREEVAQLGVDLELSLGDREAARADIARLQRDIEALRTVRASLEGELATIVALRDTDAAERARLLAELGTARDQRLELETALDLSGERTALAQREVDTRTAELARLTAEVGALADQLQTLEVLLDAREQEVTSQSTTIASLGERLNVALATQVEELSRYRSDFFGRLRRVLGEREDVRIVGDRFVFQSEVLFGSGEAEIAPAGREQLAALATAFKEIGVTLPEELPWVLQVDGHTDRRPISTPRFPSNWELSTARAISVARFLIEQGIPAGRVAARGFAEFAPLDLGDNDAAWRRNRRIELQLTTR